MYARAFTRRQARAHLIGHGQHRADSLAELLAAVQIDPPLITRVG